MAYFNKAYPKMFVGSGAILSSGHPHDLKAGQIALVDYKSNAIIAAGNASKSAHPLAYLAIGSYANLDNLGNTNTATGSSNWMGGRKESDKTKGINPSYVSKFWKSAPTAGQNHVIQIGWDGSTDCTCPQIFQKETTYNLLVEVKGTPVLKALHRNLYKTFSVFTGCAGKCSDLCVDTADPGTIFTAWANQINNDKLISAFASAVVGKRSNALPSDAVAYNVYTLTVQDAGDIQALAGLQVAYPALDITRISYTGITSVYKVTKTGAAPATYNSVAWASAGTVYKVTRKLCITLPMAVAAADTLVTAALSTRNDIVANSIVPYVESDAHTNAGTYTSVVSVTQLSKNFVTLTNDGISDALFDGLQSVNGQAFKLCPCEAAADATGCYFLRIQGNYTDSTFSDCSFDPNDLYDPTPVLVGAQLVDESNGVCEIKGLAVTELQTAKIPTGSGEEVIREYMIYRAYKQDIFDANPRMREIFDDTIMKVVKRGKKYIKYFILHSVPRFDNPSGMFDNDQYLIQVVFEEGTDTSAFETLLNNYITSTTTGVVLETK